jgi:DNA-3-methyladenine glycosylase II
MAVLSQMWKEKFLANLPDPHGTPILGGWRSSQFSSMVASLSGGRGGPPPQMFQRIAESFLTRGFIRSKKNYNSVGELPTRFSFLRLSETINIRKEMKDVLDKYRSVHRPSRPSSLRLKTMRTFRYGDAELDHLRKRDKKLKEAIDRIGMIEREVTPDLFTALVYCIAGQQISAKAASTVCTRIEDRFRTITPETIATAAMEEIQQCGLSLRKAGYIRDIAEAVAKGDLDLTALTGLPDDEVIRILTSRRGVGTWTAEMLLIFSMERPDIVSRNDLAIRRGMMNLYGNTTLSDRQFERYRKRYSPYGSVASLYLWALSHEG